MFDFSTGEFHCTFCGHTVEEDMSAMPKKDSRLLLAKFNEQLQPLYDLLREVEDIKLSPECLEPEPTDLDSIRGYNLTNSILNLIFLLLLSCFQIKQEQSTRIKRTMVGRGNTKSRLCRRRDACRCKSRWYRYSGRYQTQRSSRLDDGEYCGVDWST